MSYGNFEFESPIPSSHTRVYGYQYKNDDQDHSGVLLKWAMLMEARDWGVASITPVINHIDITIDYQAFTLDETWLLECECDQVGRRSTSDVMLAPTEIELDFDAKRITVWFRI
jgi:hypothetical protein